MAEHIGLPGFVFVRFDIVPPDQGIMQSPSRSTCGDLLALELHRMFSQEG